jgi:hypothetical protein
VKHKNTKSTYRLRNWKEYNSSLVKRGSLTLRINEEVIAQWHHPPPSVKRGKPRTYSEMAILCMARLAEIYNLLLRATQGLLASLIKLMKMTLCSCLITRPCRGDAKCWQSCCHVAAKKNPCIWWWIRRA